MIKCPKCESRHYWRRGEQNVLKEKGILDIRCDKCGCEFKIRKGTGEHLVIIVHIAQ